MENGAMKRTSGSRGEGGAADESAVGHRRAVVRDRLADWPIEVVEEHGGGIGFVPPGRREIVRIARAGAEADFIHPAAQTAGGRPGKSLVL